MDSSSTINDMYVIVRLQYRWWKENKIVPNFLIDNNQNFLNEEILIDGLRLVGDYLEKSILKPNNINYPLNRLRFLNTFK